MTRTLTVLALSALLLAACGPASSANPNAPAGGYHLVRAGETYDSIAAQHGVETSALLAQNKLTPDAPLRAGQPLGVPAATRPASGPGAPAAPAAPGAQGVPAAPVATTAAAAGAAVAPSTGANASNPAPATKTGAGATSNTTGAPSNGAPAAQAPAAQAPEAAPPVAAAEPSTPGDPLDVRPAPPPVFSEEWRDAQLERLGALVASAKALYTQVREGPGGIFIVIGVGLVAAFLALQLVLWLGKSIVVASLPGLKRLGGFGHELVLNVWYAAWWAGLAFYVPGKKAWTLIQPWAEPRARALGRFAMERGTTWSRAGAAWVAAQSKRAAIAVRDEGIDALAELALTRPALRGVSARLQEMAYSRDSHAMRGAPSALGAWPPSEDELLEALEAGAITVEFAPMFDINAAHVTALATSLSWERDGVRVTDARLVTALERPGYTRVARSVLALSLREACERVGMATDASDAPVIAVALGKSQFYDPTLFSTLRAALTTNSTPASMLELSVDERALISDLVAAGEILQRLRELGVRTTVRDFGAMTEEQLRLLGVSGVTVDFWNSRRDERISRYVAESVRTAHQLRIPVTANRAETPDEVEFARSLACERLASQALQVGALSGADIGERASREADSLGVAVA